MEDAYYRVFCLGIIFGFPIQLADDGYTYSHTNQRGAYWYGNGHWLLIVDGEVVDKWYHW